MTPFRAIARWWSRPLIDPAAVQKEPALNNATPKPAPLIQGSKAWAEAEAKRLNERESLEWRARGDDWTNFDLSNFEPGVAVREYLPGRFLCHEKLEVPIQFIESITVQSFGKRPGISCYMADGYSRREESVGWHVRQIAFGDPQDAVIKVTMNSGQSHVTLVHPKALEITLAALNAAWKGIAA